MPFSAPPLRYILSWWLKSGLDWSWILKHFNNFTIFLAFLMVNYDGNYGLLWSFYNASLGLTIWFYTRLFILVFRRRSVQFRYQPLENKHWPWKVVLYNCQLQTNMRKCTASMSILSSTIVFRSLEMHGNILLIERSDLRAKGVDHSDQHLDYVYPCFSMITHPVWKLQVWWP